MKIHLLMGLGVVALVLAAAPARVDANVGPGAALPGVNVNVVGTATPVGSIFQYRYTVTNLTPIFPGPGPFPSSILDSGAVLNDFLVPFFDNAAVVPGIIQPGSLIMPPGWIGQFQPAAVGGWNYTTASDPALISNPNPYIIPASNFAAAPFVLHFSIPVNGIPFGQSGQFGFDSLDGPGAGPVEVGFTTGQVLVDPPIVNGPAVRALAAVPEPLTAVSAASALAVLSLAATRRRRTT